jgi:STE24 endopeptidase
LNRPGRARVALGAATGLTLSYAAVRAYEAWRDRKSPAPARPRDPKRYGDARRLLAVTGMVRSAAGVALWSFGVADAGERALQSLPRPLRLPAFIAFVTLIDTLREWPVDYNEDFVMERIYGNSDRSAADWTTERLKATAVGAGVTAVLAFGADAIIHRAPQRWPWIAILATPPLLAFAGVIAPTFILPLFNKYVPLEGELERRIRDLASRYGVGAATILRFDMSRQTKKANAFVTGVFGTERIAIADTLLGEFADDETLFVVAHELGHYVRRDPWVGIGVGTLLGAVTLLGANAMVRRTTGRGAGGIGNTMRLGFYVMLGQLAAMPPANAFSRAIERRADRFALAATNDPQSGVRAFRRLRDQNLAEDEGPKWAELLLASHPSLRSRIERLELAASSAAE